MGPKEEKRKGGRNKRSWGQGNVSAKKGRKRTKVIIPQDGETRDWAEQPPPALN